MYWNAAPRGFNGGSGSGSEYFTDPSTPKNLQTRNGEEAESPSRFSPGLLDLHSFDTELLSEVGFCLPIEVDLNYEVQVF